MEHELGRKISEVQANKKMIVVRIISYFAAIAFICFATFIILNTVEVAKDSIQPFIGFAIILFMIIGLLINVFIKLRRLKDTAIFYENGFVYRDKTYLFKDAGKLHWLNSSFYLLGGIPTPIKVKSLRNQKGTVLLTSLYLDDVYYQFNAAYNNHL